MQSGISAWYSLPICTTESKTEIKQHTASQFTLKAFTKLTVLQNRDMLWYYSVVA